MGKVVVERIHQFSYGHKVTGHEGACKNLHGHNATVHFTVEADELDSVGRVIDFSVIKSMLCAWLEEVWDHKFLIQFDDPWYDKLKAIDPTVLGVTFNPTAENLAKFLVDIVGPVCLEGTGTRLVKVRFEETAKCCAIYQAGE